MITLMIVLGIVLFVVSFLNINKKGAKLTATVGLAIFAVSITASLLSSWNYNSYCKSLSPLRSEIYSLRKNIDIKRHELEDYPKWPNQLEFEVKYKNANEELPKEYKDHIAEADKLIDEFLAMKKELREKEKSRQRIITQVMKIYSDRINRLFCNKNKWKSAFTDIFTIKSYLESGCLTVAYHEKEHFLFITMKKHLTTIAGKMIEERDETTLNTFHMLDPCGPTLMFYMWSTDYKRLRLLLDKEGWLTEEVTPKGLGDTIHLSIIGAYPASDSDKDTSREHLYDKVLETGGQQ